MAVCGQTALLEAFGKGDGISDFDGTTPERNRFEPRMANNGVTCSMSRFGNVGDDTAMERFFSSL